MEFPPEPYPHMFSASTLDDRPLPYSLKMVSFSCIDCAKFMHKAQKKGFGINPEEAGKTGIKSNKRDKKRVTFFGNFLSFKR